MYENCVEGYVCIYIYMLVKWNGGSTKLVENDWREINITNRNTNIESTTTRNDFDDWAHTGPHTYINV